MGRKIKIILGEISDLEKLRLSQKIVKNLLSEVLKTDLGLNQVVYHIENYPNKKDILI